MSFAVRQTLETAKASKAENLFKGLSTLRADEKKNSEGPPKNAALSAYLAKNYGGGDDGKGIKKKKKRKEPDAGGAIRIVDHDAAGMPPPDAKARKAAAKRGPGMPYGDDDEEEEEGECWVGPAQVAGLKGRGWLRVREGYGSSTHVTRLTSCRALTDAPTIANPEEAEALKKLAEKVSEGAGSAGALGCMRFTAIFQPKPVTHPYIATRRCQTHR